MTIIGIVRRVRPSFVIGGLAVLICISAAMADTPYPTPTRDGRERLNRTGTPPTGYVAKGDKIEAIHPDTPRAYQHIDGTRCPDRDISERRLLQGFPVALTLGGAIQ